MRNWSDWFGGSRHTIWAMVWAMAALMTSDAAAQPVFDDAYMNMQRNSVGYAWIDDYLVDSPDGLDYSSLTIASDAQNGTVSMYAEWGLLIYEPDPDYEGFDGFTFTIRDEQGVESVPNYVLVYVEPDGSVTNLQPVIVGFRVIDYGNNTFGFEGRVVDDQDSYGRLVEFGGELAGQTATVGYDGFIGFVTTMVPNNAGNVTVRYLDPYNVYSEPRWEWVENY